MTGLNPQSAAQVGFDLAGHTALVTGASSGSGVHFARCLAGHGARVAVAARRAEKVATLAEEINATNLDIWQNHLIPLRERLTFD